MHAARYIHRDLKPSNVLMRRVKGKETPVLIDFGVARDYGLPHTPGEFVGSPPYMAPEQIRGEMTDPRTDIHGLGLIIWWDYCRMGPFEAVQHIGEDTRTFHNREAVEIAARIVSEFGN